MNGLNQNLKDSVLYIGLHAFDNPYKAGDK